MSFKTLIIVVCLCLLLVSAASAGVPQMINYQGKITTPTGALVDTTVQMTFTIYDDSTSGNVLWADTLGSVTVEKGIFSVLLGSVNPIPDSVFTGAMRYLGVKVGANPDDPEMSPRKAIVSVAYARTDGDWTISGNNIYRLTGNVGIGTTNPQENLDVNGGIRIAGTSNNNPGTIRWTGSSFEGYTGTEWKKLDEKGGVDWSSKIPHFKYRVTYNSAYDTVAHVIGSGYLMSIQQHFFRPIMNAQITGSLEVLIDGIKKYDGLFSCARHCSDDGATLSPGMLSGIFRFNDSLTVSAKCTSPTEPIQTIVSYVKD